MKKNWLVSIAVDVCYAEGHAYQESEHTLTWEQIGKLAETHGLTWGGRFRSRPDRPHVQWANGLSLSDLRAGKVPPDGA